jgi:hypothetical protein
MRDTLTLLSAPALVLYRGTRFGFYALHSLPLSPGFTVQQRPHGPHTYVKATACLRDKMASHSLPFPIFLRRNTLPDLDLLAMAILRIRRARQTGKLNCSRTGLPNRPTHSAVMAPGTQTVLRWGLYSCGNVGQSMLTVLSPYLSS